MNKKINVRVDDKTLEILNALVQKLNISKSDIVRMSIAHFKNYVDKVNK